jgi:uncharacterized OB-fold protein
VHATRILPALDDHNRAFWTGGFDGQLLIERCESCARWQHPPVGRCLACDGEVVAQPVSGRGTVFTFTVNCHAFRPDVPPPYVIAIVELDEQADLRVVANVVGGDAETVTIGMAVAVDFEVQDEYAVPVFRPVGS